MCVQRSWSLAAFDRKKVVSIKSFEIVSPNVFFNRVAQYVHMHTGRMHTFVILLVYWCRLQGICFNQLSAFYDNLNCSYFRRISFSCKFKRLTPAWPHFAKVKDECACTSFQNKFPYALKSASRVYELIWKKLSLQATNAAEGWNGFGVGVR